MLTGMETAAAIADGVGGTWSPVPTEGRTEYVVALADGRIPVLVREHAHAVGVCVIGSQVWSAKLEERSIAPIVDVTKTWAASREPNALTLYELATVAARELARVCGEAWTVGFPGTSTPREAWLHGANAASASVGVFDRRIVVWVDRDAREITPQTRDAIDLAPVIEAVRAQRASYDANVAATKEIARVGKVLAGKLSERLGVKPTFLVAPEPRHDLISTATIALRGTQVIVSWREGAPHAQAGVRGVLGWSGALTDDSFDGIVDAIERAGNTLTIDKLVPGRRYRVREALQQLVPGTVVRFHGFDDIDNHYGKYEFVGDGGTKLAVEGDFSRPEHSPLGDAYRYLEPVD
jgi:hypothetical protein